MRGTSVPLTPFAGPGLVLRLANGPLGRALIGAALGIALFAAQGAGWFRLADLSMLDRMNALTHRPWEPAPGVVVAAPSRTTDASVHRAALQQVLDAGATVVGFDETLLGPVGRAQSGPRQSLLSLAGDPRCVIAETVPGGGLSDLGPARARLATMERFVHEAGRARTVLPRAFHEPPEAPVGFVRQVAVKALRGYPRTGEARQRIDRSLAILDSQAGMLLDYSLRPEPLQLTTLEAVVAAPRPALRERVQGRIVLLSGSPWSTVTGAGVLSGEAAPRATEPAIAWALASVLSGTGSAEPPRELLGSALVLAALLLMLVMGDRGLGGKLVAAGVALVALVGVSLACLVRWNTFVAPCPTAAAIGAAFLISVCLELAEAGTLIAGGARLEPTQAPWGNTREPASPAVAVEGTLRSILGWHRLSAAALLLRDAATPAGLVVVSAEGEADWGAQPALQALGDEALLAGTPAVGQWPDGAAKALAIPVVLGPGRGAALILRVAQLPARRDAVEFGMRVVRQLLATRDSRGGLSPTLPGAAARPHELPLPAQVGRLRAAQAARQEQVAVAAAWRAGPHEAVVVFDTSGRPVVWNRRAQRLFGGGDLDLATTHIVPLLAAALETSQQEVRDAAMGVLLDGAPYIGDLEEPGGHRNYVVSLTRVGSDPEAPAGLALRCVDVTGVCRPARVEARLMSIAAHEMRTPLTSVLGYAELLEDQTEPDSRARRYAQAIHRQAERMEAVVAELLTVTRLEAGREELTVEPVDMALVAQEVAAELQPLADARHIRLSVDDAAGAQVRGDVPKLERVIENLVTNAIKYSPEGASVSLHLRREGDRVILDVQDTGHGIPAEDAPHVFEKFYRAKTQGSESVEGTGLGLAIVRLIVEAHGGSVSVRTAEGTGSTFTVALPVAGPPERKASDPAA